MLVYSAPLIVTALGGVFSEKSGVVNIGLEGIMIIGALASIVFNLEFSETFGNMTHWYALIVGVVIGGIFALLLAVAAVSFRADQTVTGVALNMLALGGAVFFVRVLYNKGQTDVIKHYFSTKNSIPFLSDIPFIGKLFFHEIPWTSVIAILLAFVSWYIIYKTAFGLRLRAVGEHPMAADTMGINVTRMRYIAVFISGMFGGLGGAIYAETITLNFAHNTIAGQGFIALAALIFGKWHPIGAMGAALFFGFAQILSIVGNNLPFFETLPKVVLYILPYVLTIFALAGFIGKAEGPAASGTPYVKGKR
jgi:simple sugar transport system permease protein